MESFGDEIMFNLFYILFHGKVLSSAEVLCGSILQ